MLSDLIDLVSNSEDYVCAWRNGELYIEPVLPAARLTADERLAA
jgi:hypothetical protein